MSCELRLMLTVSGDEDVAHGKSVLVRPNRTYNVKTPRTESWKGLDVRYSTVRFSIHRPIATVLSESIVTIDSGLVQSACRITSRSIVLVQYKYSRE